MPPRPLTVLRLALADPVDGGAFRYEPADCSGCPFADPLGAADGYPEPVPGDYPGHRYFRCLMPGRTFTAAPPADDENLPAFNDPLDYPFWGSVPGCGRDDWAPYLAADLALVGVPPGGPLTEAQQIALSVLEGAPDYALLDKLADERTAAHDAAGRRFVPREELVSALVYCLRTGLQRGEYNPAGVMRAEWKVNELLRELGVNRDTPDRRRWEG